MGILALSSRNKPEEGVRQAYIQRLIEGGIDPCLIVVEKKIDQLPHLSLQERQKAPYRRIDILCYQKGAEGLLPHLLVECKAVPLKAYMKRQLIGYNYYIKAPILVLVSFEAEWVGRFEGEGYLWDCYPWSHPKKPDLR